LNETRIAAVLTEPFGASLVRAAAAAPHAEHGTALVIGIDGDVIVAGVRGRAVIVPPDTIYAATSAGPAATFTFDPELCPEVAAFARAGGARALDDDRIAGAAIAHRAELARPDVLAGVAAEAARALAIGSAARSIDRRVAHALEALRDPDGALPPMRVSRPHLRALFARDVGVSIRTYRVWRRVLHALARVGPLDLTDAAHAAGFADLAHFSRTCRRMLGYAPSALRAALATGMQATATPVQRSK
jgi:hypothetical protein